MLQQRSRKLRTEKWPLDLLTWGSFVTLVKISLVEQWRWNASNSLSAQDPNSFFHSPLISVLFAPRISLISPSRLLFSQHHLLPLPQDLALYRLLLDFLPQRPPSYLSSCSLFLIHLFTDPHFPPSILSLLTPLLNQILLFSNCYSFLPSFRPLSICPPMQALWISAGVLVDY